MKIIITLLSQKKNQLLIIVILTFLAYVNIFQNGFMIDDKTFIVDWPQVKNVENLPDLLKGEVPEIHKGVYRPIRSTLYLVYQQIFGENPVGYHIHSIIVHLLATILVYFLVMELIKKKYVAFLTSLMFGLHPVHTESITYISASMEMSGVVFFLASFLLYLKSKNILSVVFAILAFFTYEMTLTLPFLIILYDLCFKKLNFKNLSKQILVYSPYFIATASFLILRVFILQIPFSRGDYLGFSFYHTMLTMSKVMMMYIGLLIFPNTVSYIHDLAPGFESFMTPHSNIQSILVQTPFDLDILFSILVLISLVFVAIKYFKKFPLITFCIGWFFLSLLPVDYFFPQGIAIADKYLYISSISFFLLLSYFIIWLSKKYKWITIITILLLITYFFLTFIQNQAWKDPISFWTKVESQHPKSALAAYTLGVTYGDQGNFEKAKYYFLKTIDLDPRFWEARYNLGNIYLKTQRGDLAGEQFYQVVLINPEFTPAQKILDQLIIK
ncbi:MAG: tetratricopeptide repeat protein [Microgenomates group bacterium]|jgi:hypothetical protein